MLLLIDDSKKQKGVHSIVIPSMFPMHTCVSHLEFLELAVLNPSLRIHCYLSLYLRRDRPMVLVFVCFKQTGSTYVQTREKPLRFL